MNYLKNIKWTPLNVLKAVGVVLAIVLVLSVGFRLINPVVSSLARGVGFDGFAISAPSGAPGVFQRGGDDAAYDMEKRAAQEEMGFGGGNVVSPVPRPGGTVGDDAEEYEVTEYRATIETRDKSRVCTEIAELKNRTFVIFENANEYDRGCQYTFKVTNVRSSEVLEIISNLEPKDLSENTYTIERQVTSVTSEEEILQNKLEAINATLEGALAAYDDITNLATRTQNADALAKIIDSRVNIIERLSRERVEVAAQLERIERSKAELLDQLEYTRFYVNVYENKFVDGEVIADSWKSAVQRFVRDINQVVQDVTVNLVGLLFFAAQYLLYFFLVLFVVKYAWRATKYLWRR